MTLLEREGLSHITIENPINTNSEISSERKDRIKFIAKQITTDYLLYTTEKGKSWHDYSHGLKDKSVSNQLEIDTRFTGVEHLIITSVNKLFGEMNSSFLDINNPDQQVTLDQLIDAARWQSEAIIALTKLSNLKISPIDNRKLLDFFYSFVNRSVNLKYTNKDSAQEIKGKLISGIYGPVAMTKFLSKNGYRVWIPDAEDDVRYKVDLIFSPKSSTTDKNVYYLAQLKSKRGQDDTIEIFNNPNEVIGIMDSKEYGDWQKLSNFTDRVNNKIGGEALDFLPVWSKISHVGLETPDDWRSRVDYISHHQLADEEVTDGS